MVKIIIVVIIHDVEKTLLMEIEMTRIRSIRVIYNYCRKIVSIV